MVGGAVVKVSLDRLNARSVDPRYQAAGDDRETLVAKIAGKDKEIIGLNGRVEALIAEKEAERAHWASHEKAKVQITTVY